MDAYPYRMDCSYNKCSGYLTSAATLEGAIEKAAWARQYYNALYPDTVQVSLWVSCDACNGKGRIAKGRRNVRFPKYVNCAHCHARGCLPIPAVA
jgi:hypothetical protein